MKWMKRMTSTNSLPGPEDILRQELPNGVVLLMRPAPISPSVAVQGYLPAGSLFDSDEKLGLADFTAACLMRGTQQRSFQEIYAALESAGASLGFSGGTHTVGFYAKSLSEDLGLTLALMADALRRPTFPGAYVERLRAQLLASLAIRAQDTGDVASLAFDALVYPHHPYGRPDDGTPETVSAILRDDLVEFHCRHYGPRGLTLAITGRFDPQQAADLVQAHLGDWDNPLQPTPPPLPPLAPLAERQTRRVTLAGKSQADLVIGAAGPARSEPDYLAASLGNNILGQFGMMGRIGEVVREQAGLAYYASSSLGGGQGPGPWEVSAGVDPQNVERAIDLILQELARFVSQPVSSEELADTQANYIGRLPLSFESNAGVASALLSLERYHLEPDYYRRYPNLVQAVTAGQILETARRYLDPQRVAIAIAGP